MFFLFPFTENFCRTVNKMSAREKNTLMSISDGLGPSIFCRKMEKARPMREEMDGKVVYFPPESAFSPLMLYLSTALFPNLYFDLACKQFCLLPGKSINRRNENTTSELFGNLTEIYRTFESHSSELLKIFQELFRTFSKTLSICIEPSSERVYNNL